MVKQNTGTGINIIRLAIVCGFPKRGGFRYCIWAPGPKWSFFISGYTSGISETFAGARVLQTYGFAGKSNRLKQIKCADANTL